MQKYTFSFLYLLISEGFHEIKCQSQYKEVSPPDTAFVTLQKKRGKLEVKLGVGYTDKEARYSSGKSKRLSLSTEIKDLLLSNQIS